MATFEGFITTREAARKGDISTQYVSYLAQQGKIKGQRVSNLLLIESASFDAWLARRAQRLGAPENAPAEEGAQGA